MNACLRLRQLIPVRGYRTLISTNSLSDALNNKTTDDIVVLDCTFSAVPEEAFNEKYMKSRIPGAKFFNHHTCVTSTSLIPRNIPEQYCFTRKLRQLGISRDTDVVVYDRGTTSAYAARVWWLLRLFGHERVSILDGGLMKWMADGHDINTNGLSKVQTGSFYPGFNENLICDKIDVERILEDKSSQIVDSRGRQYFSGSTPHSEDITGGHIPGAVNIPNGCFYNEDGTFKSRDEIKEVFQNNGVDLTEPVVSMCRTGVNACSLASAAHVAGKEDVTVYYGSWTEWAQVHSNLITKAEDKTQG